MALTRVRPDLVDTTAAFSNSVTFSANVILSSSSALVANGSPGSTGQVLTSNGTAVYWSTATSTTSAASLYTYSIILGRG
jgi:hypothetical protein